MTKGKNAAPKGSTASAETKNSDVAASHSPAKRNPPPSSNRPGMSFGDKLALTWVAFAFWIHAAFAGVWLFYYKDIPTAPAVPSTPESFFALFHNAWKKEGALLAVYDTCVLLLQSLWKGYALADKRFATGNSFIRALFSVNFYFVAPALIFLGYAIANRRNWRHSLQLVLTTIELFGVALYFVTEHLNGYANVNSKSVKDYNIYFWAANLAFAFPMLVLFLQSYFSDRTREPKSSSNRIAFVVKFVVGASTLGFGFLLSAALAHHYLDSAEVQKLLLEALDTTQHFAAEAYTTTSAVAAEAYTTASAVAADGLHQAHVLAAPYVEQAADFLHDNLGK